MPVAKRSKTGAIQFKQFDVIHAVAARASLGTAMCHLAEATASLKFGVPYEIGDKLGMIITYVDCATSLLREARNGLANWPEPPLPEWKENEVKEWPKT